MALVVIYLLFFYKPSHFYYVKFLKNYMSNYTRRLFQAIDNFYDPNAKYEL